MVKGGFIVQDGNLPRHGNKSYSYAIGNAGFWSTIARINYFRRLVICYEFSRTLFTALFHLAGA
jgi:hypothetical protein